MTHRLPIALRAHDHADEGGSFAFQGTRNLPASPGPLKAKAREWKLFSFFLLASFALACAPTETKDAAFPAPHSAEADPEALELPALPLSQDELEIQKRLQVHVQELAVRIGERHLDRPWELADAADSLAARFEDLGYTVERQGYEIDGVVAHNLAVTIPGGARGDEVFLVTAHYDSPHGKAGKNAGASGAVAILELARLMRDARPARTLRLVLFAIGEPPFSGEKARGSWHYAESLNPDDSRRVIGVLELDRIGAFPFPRGASEKSPTRHNLRLGLGQTEGWSAELREGLEGPPFAIEESSLDPAAPGDRDAQAFLSRGIPSASLSGEQGDAEIDYEALSRLVGRLKLTLARTLGEKFSNDAMLTPEPRDVR